MGRVEDRVEDRQGDWRQEDGGPALDEVERDGGVHVRAAAAACGGHFQELRGLVAHCVPRRERRGHARQDRHRGAEGGCEEEVSASPGRRTACGDQRRSYLMTCSASEVVCMTGISLGYDLSAGIGCTEAERVGTK